MGKNLDHDDLGIDLERVAALPTCEACRKKSDGSKKCTDGTVLCGTDYDTFLKTSPVNESAASWAKRMRETKYKACWEAKLDE